MHIIKSLNEFKLFKSLNVYDKFFLKCESVILQQANCPLTWTYILILKLFQQKY